LNNKIERLGDFSLPKEEQSDGEGYFLNALFTKTEPKPEEVMPYVIPEAEIIPDIAPDTLPKKDKGKAKETEPEQTEEPQPEASTSKNTEPTEPKELSAESQQIIKLVNEVLISEPTEPSGDQVETIFAPEIKTFPEPKIKILKVIREAERKLLGPVKIDNTNRLYKLKPDKRQELIGKFSGLDKVIADKLAEKVGTRQESTPQLIADHVIVGSIIPALPI